MGEEPSPAAPPTPSEGAVEDGHAAGWRPRRLLTSAYASDAGYAEAAAAAEAAAGGAEVSTLSAHHSAYE